MEQELGRKFNIDQNEIMDIVLGNRLWPTTFDLPLLREMLATYQDKAKRAASKLEAPSPAEQAVAKLLDEAWRWLSKADGGA